MWFAREIEQPKPICKRKDNQQTETLRWAVMSDKVFKAAIVTMLHKINALMKMHSLEIKILQILGVK